MLQTHQNFDFRNKNFFGQKSEKGDHANLSNICIRISIYLGQSDMLIKALTDMALCRLFFTVMTALIPGT